MAAGLGVQAAMKASPELQGSSITVLGCPAEEGGGGKIDMIEKGNLGSYREEQYYMYFPANPLAPPTTSSFSISTIQVVLVMSTVP